MNICLDNRLNPNPITKLFVVGFLGFTVVHFIHSYAEWGIILVLSLFFAMNGFVGDAIKNIIIYGILFLAPNFKILEKLPILIKIFLSLVFVLRMFYLPFVAGKFLIKTSDVGSILSSMDKLKIPNCLSIPIAVMFRYFPSFKEERKNIKWAMRVRGIKTINPICYLEYVFVPLLIISSNIADDIARAAETKCIANPIKKTRYTKVSIKSIDFIYGFIMLALVIGGRVCLK